MFFFKAFLFSSFLFGIYSKSIQNSTNEEQDSTFLRNEVKFLKERLDNLTEIVEKGTKNRQKSVLYFVRLSSKTTLNINSIVKYDKVITDEGGNFNPGDGIFVCPVTGIYLFSWTVFTASSKIVDTELRVDNVIIDSMYVYIGTSSHVPATKVVLCQVKKGDHVWIQTSAHTTENVFETPTASRSSFTGMLVHEN
ncbi:complement C1q tumor necrosis factor-related protein 2-like [Mytilus trossulus]|uniref:complement C1q tumor necrosis factor-related protein 2-like n=1 Tax=Mytilus trossulus TaxID=6551 RepID=UPI0030075C14